MFSRRTSTRRAGRQFGVGCLGLGCAANWVEDAQTTGVLAKARRACPLLSTLKELIEYTEDYVTTEATGGLLGAPLPP